MRRREFLKAAIASLALGCSARSKAKAPTRSKAEAPTRPAHAASSPQGAAVGSGPVRWAPYQNLDLRPHDMATAEGIARIVWWADEFQPQGNSDRKGSWDPRHPEDPANNLRLPGWGKRIHAGFLSPSLANDTPKTEATRRGIERLLATGDAAVRDQLGFGSQVHTTHFDHPLRGVEVPPGFDWDWVMTVPEAVADAYRRPFLEAGYAFRVTPSVALAAERVGRRGWPTGWMRQDPESRTAKLYTIMPDLRIPECRAFFLDRIAALRAMVGVYNVLLTGKSGWLHGAARPHARVDAPSIPSPWLPSPYPGDSYRDANVALVREAVARFGGSRVTFTSTGVASAEERAARGLPAYTGLRDGGVRALFDGFYGSFRVNWTIPNLERRGVFRRAGL
jgi:hypothetical protein